MKTVVSSQCSADAGGTKNKEGKRDLLLLPPGRAKKRGLPYKAGAQGPGGYPGAKAVGALGRTHRGAGSPKLGTSAEGPPLTHRLGPP